MLTELGAFGARVRPVNSGLKEQVLVIGLGQVGLHALAKLNTMLDYSLPPRYRLDNTRLLAIAARKSIRQEQLLPRENRLLLKTDPIRWSDIPGRFATQGVAKWWPRTPSLASLQADPTPTRAFGRFLLWTNVEIISEKLFEMAEWLQLSSERTQTPRTIFVLAALTEAEGSGMIFDVIGRLRYLLQRQPTTIIGVFSVDGDLPDEEQRLVARATVYASLKELDAITLQPEIYTHDLPLVGRAQHVPKDPPARILDHICVTGGTGAAVPEPEGALAEFTMTWLLSLLAITNTSGLVPVVPHTNIVVNRSNAYSAFGVAKLGLPVRDVMSFYSITAARSVLTNLLIPYPEPTEAWVQKIIARTHSDLMTQNLLDHHLMVDKVREINRRIAPNQLNSRYKQATQLPNGWQNLINREWDFLKLENTPTELDREGVSKPRDVLRRRMDQALEEGLHRLITDVEALAVNLAYAEGWGLKWTVRAFEDLQKEIKAQVEKLSSKSKTALRDLDRLGQQWVALANSRHFGMMDKLTQDVVSALLNWIGWEAREAAWQDFLKTIEDILNRLDLAIQQIPHELAQLESLGTDLRQQLDQAMRQDPSYPAGTLVTDAWIRDGVRHLASADQVPPHELIAGVFKRWDSGDVPPLRQLQKFLAEVIHATRLTLQPQSSFMSLREALARHDTPQAVQRAVENLGIAAAPAWTVTAITDRLDKVFVPPLAFEVVREDPNPFSLLPIPDPNRVKRLSVVSPDPDEVVSIRITHGWSAEYVQRLREEYRRAYYRVISDNVPLHIDRRWETTMADLIHTTLRTEIANLWDTAVRDNGRGARYAQGSLMKLSTALAGALEANLEMVYRPRPLVEDIWLQVFPMQSMRLKIPPPRCAFVFLLSHRGTSEITEDLFRTISATMPEENFFFVVNVAGRTDMKRILEPIISQGFMALDLSEADIKHIVSAPKPSNALRDIVIERINLSAISPFYTRAPVPDHMFFGREKEIADTRSKLSTHSVVLIGGRRIGKTSALQKLVRIMKQPQSPVVPYYLDCSSMFKHRHLFRRIEQEWGITVDDPDDPIEFEQVVNQLWGKHLGKMPIFLLDEVDRLLKTDQGDNYSEPLFRTFRSLSNEKRCQFVFSGEKLLLGSLKNAKSVLFNFPQKVKLSPLDKEVVHRLVSEPFEMLNIWLERGDDIIHRVYELSAGHPNIVQTICHALVEVVDKQKSSNLLTIEHLGQVLDWHHVQTDIVETIWGQMDPLAKLVTLLWREGVRQMGLDDIMQMLRQSGLRSVLTQTIKESVIPDLELYNFLRQEGQAYTLIPIHFPTLLDEMTNKKIEIRSILELYSREQPV